MTVSLLVGVVGITMRTATRSRLSDLEALVGPTNLEECNDHPAVFVVDDGFVRIYAYDPTGQPANPRAPSLQPMWLRDMPVGHSRLFVLPGQWWRRGAIQRIADDGPCAILWAAMPGILDQLTVLRASLLVGLFFGLTGALMSTTVLAVRPLVERLSRLDQTALCVGLAHFRSASDPGDDEIGRISRTLDEAHARIIADQETRMQRHEALESHLAAVAHDLRTPLASLQLLLEDLGTQASDAPPTMASTIRDARLEVAYLESLAGNLHQATRMVSGLSASDGEVDVTAVVDRVESRFAILARMLGGTVAAARPDEPVWIRCRPALAERALANLVHNGVIHGTGDVGIVLTATADRFTIVVRSAGPALDPRLVATLARRRLGRATDPSRSRNERTDHAEQSRGLGLAIVNAVAQSAGFTVTYEGPEDGGLAITLRGPRLVKVAATRG